MIDADAQLEKDEMVNKLSRNLIFSEAGKLGAGMGKPRSRAGKAAKVRKKKPGAVEAGPGYTAEQLLDRAGQLLDECQVLFHRNREHKWILLFSLIWPRSSASARWSRSRTVHARWS